MDCSPPGSSVHGIFPARILEWVASPLPEDMPDPGLLHGGGFFTTWAISSVQSLSRVWLFATPWTAALSPEVCSNSCPLSRWWHPTISSSVVPFSSHLQSFPESGSFQMSQEAYSREPYSHNNFSINILIHLFKKYLSRNCWMTVLAFNAGNMMVNQTYLHGFYLIVGGREDQQNNKTSHSPFRMATIQQNNTKMLGKIKLWRRGIKKSFAWRAHGAETWKMRTR